jgi:hypothetical protein
LTYLSSSPAILAIVDTLDVELLAQLSHGLLPHIIIG